MQRKTQKVCEKVGGFAESVLLCSAKQKKRLHATLERLLLVLFLLYPEKVKR